MKNSSGSLSRRCHFHQLRATPRRQTKAARVIRPFILMLLVAGTIATCFYIAHVMSTPFPYADLIKKYATHNDLDPLLVAAVIREESRFQPLAVSNKGACGLMQLMPDTAKEVAAQMGETCTRADLMRSEANIRYGTAYLAFLVKKYDGDIVLALAAYNAGFGRVDTWATQILKTQKAFTIDDIPFRETRDYVRKVLQSYEKYQQNEEPLTGSPSAVVRQKDDLTLIL